uniref:Putative secreted protein n=1 Tax=Ixodes ricinus TaxID=34613 RepID=A0A6B0TSN4_IXORI
MHEAPPLVILAFSFLRALRSSCSICYRPRLNVPVSRKAGFHRANTPQTNHEISPVARELRARRNSHTSDSTH